MTSQKLARIISEVFGIRVLPFFLITLLLIKSELTIQQLLIVTPITVFLLILVPIFYIYFAIKYNRASNWDLSNRKERYGFVKVTLTSGLLCLGFVYFLGNSLLFKLNLVSLITLALIGIVTRFWKISFHASLITITTILVNFLFNWNLPILYLLIPLIFWARYTLKHHSLNQLLAGSLLSGAITLIALKLFGYQ